MTYLSPNALEILENRYLLKKTVMETPEQLFQRVANHLASIEKEDIELWSEKFYQIMSNLEFLPNSPTLMNAGLPKGQLSACFVLPIEDSLEAIFTTLKNAVLIQNSGGGTGYNFSKLRPKDDILVSTGGTSSGPLAFLKIFDTATEHVKQGGKRRGANMGILNVDHPDIQDFITSKSDGKSLQNFNISVGITNNFMQAVQNDSEWQLINPRTKKVHTVMKAKVLWNFIIEEAHKTGDPGLIFLDNINTSNPLKKQGVINSTNPCGEVPLLDFESCNLGSINLTKMVANFENEIKIDWKKLENTINTAIRFLDNVISCNYYFLPEIKEKTQANRKIGLGVMGWAELLILLDIPYASNEAVSIAEKLMQFIQEKSYEASKILALERGNFPNWNENMFTPNRQMRNATCNSIAPTGSISVIANTSYAIEPLYALSYKRVGILGNKTQMETNHIFKSKIEQLNLWNEVVKIAIESTGGIQELMSIPKHIKKLFETSMDIPWLYHLKHQKAFQKYTDNAVSKTINLPNHVRKSEIAEIFKTAWKYNLKGVTIYRNGSKINQVLQTCGKNRSMECSS
tara:strand:+ start:4651 stop:6366 length:1716 start_codon:yes stop_codon:yes gene_type:complete